MENKDWIKGTFLKEKPTVNFASHPTYPNRRTNPKVNKETAGQAKRTAEALCGIKAAANLTFCESYWKKNYTAGIDPCEIGGNSHATIVLFKGNRIVYHTKKLWKINLLIWVLKILGIKILSETNEKKK